VAGSHPDADTKILGAVTGAIDYQHSNVLEAIAPAALVVQRKTEAAAFPEMTHKSTGDAVVIAEVAADLQETVHTVGLGAEENWGNILPRQDEGPALACKVSPVGLGVTEQRA